TAFAHLGGDIDASSAWQVGLSHVHTDPQGRQFDDPLAGVTDVFTGRSRTWIADFVYKWAPEGNPRETNFKLQGEYFRRSEDGSLAYRLDADGNPAAESSLALRQSGWYLQGVYQFMPQWRVGYRYDRLDSGTVNLGSLSTAEVPVLASYAPTRNSMMVDWSPSEFSRLRLQLARDNSRQGEPDNQVWLQYIMSMGAHGAHKF
ncbi:MAG: hypothetical protein HGA47_05095, partial [Zoogloea sp.]|nr:hypothetical protein [Zoogloea sp.]